MSLLPGISHPSHQVQESIHLPVCLSLIPDALFSTVSSVYPISLVCADLCILIVFLPGSSHHKYF